MRRRAQDRVNGLVLTLGGGRGKFWASDIKSRRGIETQELIKFIEPVGPGALRVVGLDSLTKRGQDW